MGLELREDALAIFGAALRAADASEAVRRHLVRDGKALIADRRRHSLGDGRRVYLVAVGKAAGAMAAAVEEVLAGGASDGAAGLAEGLIVTKYGHAEGYRGACAVVEAGHPVPDAASVRAGEAVVSLLGRVREEDLLVVAVSGGASALLCAPVEGISLEDKQRTTDLLLRAGADIGELNCVRKHLSRLKGGRLVARANGASVLGLVLSDAVGDAFDVIGSGLTAPDPSTFAQAVEVLLRRGIAGQVSAAVLTYLERGAAGDLPETPKAGGEVFARTTNVLVGSSRQALAAAAMEAERLGYQAVVVSSTVQGEASEVARAHAALVREAAREVGDRRVCLLSGGETTVTVRGAGKGGRNQEFALALAMALDGEAEVACLSAGTDGTDGPTDAAGAMITGETVRRAQAMGLDAAEYLERNDSYAFFERLGDLVKTGPTGTNVMDVNVMLVGRRAR